MEIDDTEIVREFLIESNENLGRLDQEMVDLEQRPGDGALLASVFRTIHTIKGTCAFLGFSNLEAVAHSAENALSKLRNGELELKPSLVSLILEAVDAIRGNLAAIEETGKESSVKHDGLRQRLQAACEEPAEAEPQPVTASTSAAPEHEPGNPRQSSVSESTIRVDVGLLDKLMNLVGELVLARNQILQVSAAQEDSVLNATSQRLNLITTELQESVMRTRMQPIGVVWNKFPRVVRDVAASCGKQVQLLMDGAETELDKTIIEAIKDPLTHIIRNCCDHGIEAPAKRSAAGKPVVGTLTLRAYHEGGHVNIEIIDDGAGLDLERIRTRALQKGVIRAEQADRMDSRDIMELIFAPGVSTAEQVTAISGRGVGMDVVKTNIEKIGGSVELASTHGHGTTIRIKIPLTLAIIPGLVVRSGGERFVIPQVSLLELVRLEGDRNKWIERVLGTLVYRRRGNLLPLVFLNDLLGLGNSEAQPDVMNMAILQADDRLFGLVVDGISDTQEIVVKPLGKQLKGLSAYVGATIMGDGNIALILDVTGIGQLSGVLGGSRGAERSQDGASKDAESAGEALLLFGVRGFERIALPLSRIARLEEIPVARLERAAGKSVIQYRGGILPLVDLSAFLGARPPEDSRGDGPVQVVVVGGGERAMGLVVDSIIDIIEENVTIRQTSSHRGLLGSAVVGGRMTDLLDLEAVVDGEVRRSPSPVDAVSSTDRDNLLRSFSALMEAVGLPATEIAGVNS